MPTGSLSTAEYAAVINDLRAKRAEIDRTIAFLEAVSGAPALELAAPQGQEPKS